MCRFVWGRKLVRVMVRKFDGVGCLFRISNIRLFTSVNGLRPQIHLGFEVEAGLEVALVSFFVVLFKYENFAKNFNLSLCIVAVGTYYFV